MTGLPDRGLEAKPDRWPHGVRSRYVAGCRCGPCTRANRVYARGRYRAQCGGDWNGLVSAEPARKHLLKLSRAGVGKRAVAAASDISLTVIAEIRQGKRTQIRANTARRILAVTGVAAKDRALVSAATTWAKVNWMLDEGFTKASIALQLGMKKPALQLGRERVTVRKVAAVERLYRRYAE